MDVKSMIDNRYSVKKFDKDFKLSEEQLDSIKLMLQASPSSVNIQPWHFTIATTTEAIEKVARSTMNFGFNDEKIRDASALIVMSVEKVDDSFLSAVTEKEDIDGRYPQVEFKEATDNGRRYFYNKNVEDGKEQIWLQSQVYLNAGHLVMGLSAMGLDSVIMEGFDPNVVAEELGFETERAVLIIGVGRGAEDDYNRKMPKSRLAQETIIDLI